MPHSSAVNGEEDILTDSTGGSAGSGIGLLLASAAGKDGSGSGSASQDSPKELESSAKAARCRVASVLSTRYCSQSNTSYIHTYIHTYIHGPSKILSRCNPIALLGQAVF